MIPCEKFRREVKDNGLLGRTIKEHSYVVTLCQIGGDEVAAVNRILSGIAMMIIAVWRKGGSDGDDFDSCSFADCRNTDWNIYLLVGLCKAFL